MAKIIFAGAPATGHTNPTLPVVRELVAHGHHVIYYNKDEFEATIVPTGVDFRLYPAPLPSAKEISEKMHSMIDASLIMSQIAEHLTPFMVNEVQRENPDLVIYDSVAMWGYVAARIHRVPNICSITHFILDGAFSQIGWRTMGRFLWSAIPHLPGLLRWRMRMAKQYGKAHVKGITDYADLNLVYTSQEFHPENGFIDDRFCFVGPSIDPTTRDGDFPFERLHDGTIVYLSLGTINHLNSEFYAAAFEAFGNYPAQFILSIGKHTSLSELGDIPENFIVQNFVPQLEILQRSHAFITHGGMNSVHEGLWYGVPEIVVPQQIEQLLNGKRIAATESGILLGDKVPYGRVTASELRNGLDKVLNTPKYRQNAKHFGDTLKASGGYHRAVSEIEAFISEIVQQSA